MGAIQLGQYGYNKLISVCYDGSNTTIKFYANGAFSAQNTSTVASLPSSSSESLKFRNLVHWGDILIYRDALSDADRELVEGYLAHKFGMLDTLPTSHSSRTSLEGWAMGKGEGPNEVSSTLSNVGNRVNGSSSTYSHPPTTSGTMWYPPSMGVHANSTSMAQRFHPSNSPGRSPLPIVPLFLGRLISIPPLPPRRRSKTSLPPTQWDQAR